VDYLISGGAGWMLAQIPFSLSQGLNLQQSVQFGFVGFVLANTVNLSRFLGTSRRGTSATIRNWALRAPWNLNFTQIAMGTGVVNCGIALAMTPSAPAFTKRSIISRYFALLLLVNFRGGRGR
jgi:hypothetical protein